MKKKTGLWIALGAGIAAGAAAVYYYKKNKKKKAAEQITYSGDEENEMFFDFAKDARVSAAEAEKLAAAAVSEKLGENASIVPASDNKTLTVNIGGSRRHCYMFGAVADDMAINPETYLFYVDAVTGEVFESND